MKTARLLIFLAVAAVSGDDTLPRKGKWTTSFEIPPNIQIQVIDAMKYFQDKVNGTSPESLAKDLADYRKFAADHVDQ